MPSPTMAQIHVDIPMTQMSIAYMQDESKYVHSKIFPNILVDRESDKYYVFDKDSFRQATAKRRADNTESAGIIWKTSTDAYSLLDPYSAHKPITQRERENQDSVIEVDRIAVRAVTQQILNTVEYEWFTNFFKTGIWGTDLTGIATGSPSASQFVRWDNYAESNPVDDIEVAKLKVEADTGKLPNKLVVHPLVHAKLRNHPLILDRTKFTSAESISVQILANYFEVDEYIVARTSINTNIELAGTKTGAYVAGKHALLCYVASAPAKEEPSAGYTFAKRNGGGIQNGVRIARIPTPLLGIGSERVEGEYWINSKITGADLGYFFSGVVT